VRSRHVPPAASALLILAFLSACGGGDSPSAIPGDTPAATFDCGDFRFTVSYRSDTAVVAMPGDTIRLPIAISASGARFSDGTSTFWEHQGAARLELPDRDFEDCPLVQG
jgi:membrane-bound inhibitor of C-type lysozyme